MTRVLVVDDEAAIRRALRANLAAREFDVESVETGEEALSVASQRPPDAVILDLGLPGIDGIEVVKALRTWSRAPIVILSARDSEAAKVAALDAGADDYVTKPFGIDELLARLRASLRRATPGEPLQEVSNADFTIDLVAKRASTTHGDVHLTPTEWHIVELLVRNAGRLVPQRELLTEVWGPGFESASNYARLYLAQIRRKLEPEPSRPRHFVTEPGMGYRYEP